MKTTLKTILILSAAIILFACGKETVETKTSTTTKIPVKVLEVNKTQWSETVYASGQFEAQEEKMLSFKIGGVIQQVYVDEGDRIKKGQILASLIPTEIESATTQAKAGLEKAKRDYERTKRLYADSVATYEQLQNSETALELAEESYKAAKFNKSYSQIRAQDDGYVLLKLGNVGEVVSGGQPILRTSGSTKKWKLAVGLSSRDWANITLGDSAIIETDAIPNTEISSRVVRKSKSAQAQGGTFLVECEIGSKYQERLASGMFGKAKIFPSQMEPGWAIPYESLLDANSGKGYVFVPENDSTAKRIMVEIARVSDQNIWIKNGLKDHKHIISLGSPYLSDGSSIIITNKQEL